MSESRNAYRVLVGRPEGIRLLGSRDLEVLDLQNDSLLKADCEGLLGIKIFEKISSTTYPLLRQFASKIMSMYSSTYQCEQLFSKMKFIKSSHRSRLSDAHLLAQLKTACTDINPNFEEIAFEK
ncbi:hypothetical protein ANN_00734 [Periplaneta americana]|uniref:HAT C-terminal dimerisation domain-containing protein n=1 Tax=Periplaneta americana TaxID=6978 RepID=A0ABQ8TRK4_PERAM|nr:hypothetical protein ANN_00734 [Periplaneta americana]